MNVHEPKELLIKTLNHEETEQVAWVPFAGVHAGKLVGYDEIEVLQDGDKLFESLMEVNKLYKPAGQPVVFDLQIEAECLGCDLVWAKDGPPSVASHPLEGTDEIEIPCLCTVPTKESGRIPMVLDVMKRMKEAVGDTTALYGLICGPFTLDSATCAACTYMMGAADEAKATFGDEIDMVEYKFTEKENIARCKKMGVPNLPSMYINGELKFRSLVPSKEDLKAAIKAVMKG